MKNKFMRLKLTGTKTMLNPNVKKMQCVKICPITSARTLR
ncbi:hypothetical protein IFVP177_C1320568 [Vibrio parahaemolyticus]|nr:hypothetical protein D046_1159 [Vibrio parahaemolyticus V-223/04]